MRAEDLGCDLRPVRKGHHASLDAQYAAVEAQSLVGVEGAAYGPLLLRHLVFVFRAVLHVVDFVGLLALLPFALKAQAFIYVFRPQLLERVVVERLKTVDVVALGLVFAACELAQVRQ